MENLRWKDLLSANLFMFSHQNLPILFIWKTENMKDSRGGYLQLKFWNVITVIFLFVELIPAITFTGDKDKKTLELKKVFPFYPVMWGSILKESGDQTL